MADELISAKIKIEGLFEIEVSGSKVETVRKLIDDLKKDHILQFMQIPQQQGVQQVQQQYPQQQQMQPQIMNPQTIPQNVPPLQYSPNFR